MFPLIFSNGNNKAEWNEEYYKQPFSDKENVGIQREFKFDLNSIDKINQDNLFDITSKVFYDNFGKVQRISLIAIGSQL